MIIHYLRCFIILSLLFLCSFYDASAQDNLMNQKAVKTSKDTVIAAAGKNYSAGGLKKILWGDHYRKSWIRTIAMPILDLKTEKKGLSILGQGGGMQTYSLKLKGNNNQLYAIRSIQKNPGPVIPKVVQETFVSDLVQDQISAAHPYGAFILPSLANAAEIYHTNPKLYYLPKNEKLGDFEEKFGNMVVMLEEDADESWSQKASFGYTKNAIGTDKLLEELLDENENYVDQNFFARARLFDMLIGDWDRHEGQWRWAELEDENGNEFYRPIPEDRDNAFFKFDGFFPYWLSRKWAFRNLRTFDYEISDIKGLNYNARYIDRRLLTKLSKKEWVAEANILQRKLTDEVIRNAVKSWPEEIYELDGEEVISKLIARRNNLTKIASDYYEVLAKQVIVYGSDESEYFDIERTTDGAIITVYDLSDREKDELIYKRQVISDETDELIIYGYAGADQFVITGKSEKGIRLRLIGGEGDDTYLDESISKGIGKKTIIYDTKKTDIKKSRETRDLVDERLDQYENSKESFNYDVLSPLVSFGYNVDDGLFIGGGFKLKKHGFGKKPFKSSQKFEANISTLTNIWNVKYNLTLTDVIGTGDLVFASNINAPNFRSNFFGFGNETTQINNRDFYNYRIDEMTFFPGLKFGGEYNTVTLGMVYERYRLRRFSDFMEITPSEFSKKPQNFIGFRFSSSIGKIDSKRITRKGILWDTELTLFDNFTEDESYFSTINSEIKIYRSIEKTYTVFATRIGGSHNIGNVPFFKASRLGGNRGLNLTGNVRGLVRDRFSGKSSIYHNIELRQLVGKSRTYLVNFVYGVNLFFDYGRVWQPGEDSNIWHNGKGFGVWASLFYNWTISASYANSNEGNTVDVQLKFLF